MTNITKTGFYIEMSTDKHFNDVFFKYYSLLDASDKVIDNLIFPLNNIFSSWEDIPDLILYRITFIDKLLCNKIQSNPVIITKEWYKYLINDTNLYKLKLNKVYKLIKHNDSMTVNSIDKDNILFIDKINCSIIKSSENENNISVNKINNPKIIYKPIFYKTVDLQNISLKSNINQNIGIDLSEYLSKVETFKLFIGQNEYIETGRNDIYVIFTINTNNISEVNGKYIITDSNDDYISSGNYIIS